MSNEPVEVLNQETGERGQIRRKLFENPRINNGILVEVEASQKPYVRELFRSRLDDTSPTGEEDSTDDTEEDEE